MEPTKENTPDLFCTNKPGLYKYCQTIPDHECLLAHCDVKAEVLKKAHRKIPKWSKAYLDKIRPITIEFKYTFLATFRNNPMDQNYADLCKHFAIFLSTRSLTYLRVNPLRYGLMVILNECVRKSRCFSPVLSAPGNPLPGSVTKPTNVGILSMQFASVFTRDSGESRAKRYGPNYPAIKPLIIYQNDVEKLLQSIKVDRAAGPDNLPCRLLKELAHELAPILTCIYKQSIDTSTLPSIWTRAFVAPVSKKGARCMMEKYRPVPLTYISCKILKYITCKYFRMHL